MYGSIELGGTKIRCAVFDKNGKIQEEIRIKTAKPDDNVKEMATFFENKNIVSLGVGAFGPIDTNRNSKTYGFVKNTPKKYWTDFDIIGNLKRTINVPVEFTSDVGASLIGEYHLGAGKDYRTSLYITVGTGICASFIQDGVLLEGYGAPEMGHIKVERLEGDNVESSCQYHKTCLEGLACGTSLYNRTKQSGESLDINNKAFDYVANYICQGLMEYSYILRPDIIILGGGVLNKNGMLDKIKETFNNMKDDYIDMPETDKYLVSPGLRNDSGLYGGYLMAKKLIEN